MELDPYCIALTLVREGVHTLPDGRTLRLIEETDTDTSVNDFECYGRVEHVASPYDHNGLRATRPKGFDGTAEKIITSHGDIYWWQPTLELWGITPAQWHSDAALRRANRLSVRDVLDHGFRLYTVEAYTTCPCCNGERLTDYNAVGGVEPMLDDADVADRVSYLVEQVL